MIVAVVLIIAAIVVYLVSTIVALQRISGSLDEAITGVTGIVDKTAPVAEVVTTINKTLDAGGRPARGPARQEGRARGRCRAPRRAVSGRRRRRAPELPRQPDDHSPADQRGLHKGNADPRQAGPRGADRRREPAGPAIRDPAYGSAAARALYPGGRPEPGGEMPPSPVIGTDSPVQYPERTDGADSSSV